MNRISIAAMILAVLGFTGFIAPAASADIYSWTDENGVRYFTNHAPPKHAKLLIKSPEIPHDEEAHRERLEEDRLAAARHELAEREAFLLQQQQEAERRIAAANARADAALQEADKILQEAEAAAESVDYDRWGSYGYSYPYYRIGPRYPYSSYKRYNLGLYRTYPYNYKRHPSKYRHHNKYRRHSAKYENFNKRPSKGINHNRHYRSRSVRSHDSLTRGRYTSHRSRAAAFRGRHGRF